MKIRLIKDLLKQKVVVVAGSQVASCEVMSLRGMSSYTNYLLREIMSFPEMSSNPKDLL